MNRIPPYLAICFTLVVLAVIGAFVALDLDHHSQDAFKVGSLLLTALGTLTTVAGVQGVWSRITQTKDAIENGTLKRKVTEAIAEDPNGVIAAKIHDALLGAMASRRSTDPPAGPVNPPAGGALTEGPHDG